MNAVLGIVGASSTHSVLERYAEIVGQASSMRKSVWTKINCTSQSYLMTAKVGCRTYIRSRSYNLVSNSSAQLNQTPLSPIDS